MRAALAAILLALLVASNLGYYVFDHEESVFPSWLFLFTLQFALFAGVVGCMSRFGVPGIRGVALAGFLARVLLLPSEPVMEADYFRYLWDGHVAAKGVNPYLYAPEAPELDGLETDYRFFINYSQYPTIYPPVAQYAFRLVHAVAPDSILGLKIFLTVLDIGMFCLLALWLARWGMAPGWAALYFLNPLVWKEVANSAHLDPIPVLLSMGALYFMTESSTRRGRLCAWGLLALAVGAKLYPLAWAPLFARCDPRWKRHAGMASVVLILLYAPFMDAGSRLFAGTMAYGELWQFNASLFQLVLLAGSPQTAARLTVGVLFLVALLWHTTRLEQLDQLPGACLSVTGMLLILSPVVDAWYVLWLLPLACLFRHVPWLAFSYLVAGAYAWFYSVENAPYFRMAEYCIFYGFWAWWSLKGERHLRPPSLRRKLG